MSNKKHLVRDSPILYGFWLETANKGVRTFKGYSTIDIANQALGVKIRKIKNTENICVNSCKVFSYRD